MNRPFPEKGGHDTDTRGRAPPDSCAPAELHRKGCFRGRARRGVIWLKGAQKCKHPPTCLAPAGVHDSCGGCTQRSSVEPRRLDAQPSRTVTIGHWITSFRKRLPAVAAEYGRRRRTLSPEPSPGAHRPTRIGVGRRGARRSVGLFSPTGGRQTGREARHHYHHILRHKSNPGCRIPCPKIRARAQNPPPGGLHVSPV